jgi:hypothetical protein
MGSGVVQQLDLRYPQILAYILDFSVETAGWSESGRYHSAQNGPIISNAGMICSDMHRIAHVVSQTTRNERRG